LLFLFLPLLVLNPITHVVLFNGVLFLFVYNDYFYFDRSRHLVIYYMRLVLY
jgi:hypothetical protein